MGNLNLYKLEIIIEQHNWPKGHHRNVLRTLVRNLSTTGVNKTYRANRTIRHQKNNYWASYVRSCYPFKQFEVVMHLILITTKIAIVSLNSFDQTLWSVLIKDSIPFSEGYTTLIIKFILYILVSNFPLF